MSLILINDILLSLNATLVVEISTHIFFQIIIFKEATEDFVWWIFSLYVFLLNSIKPHLEILKNKDFQLKKKKKTYLIFYVPHGFLSPL